MKFSTVLFPLAAAAMALAQSCSTPEGNGICKTTSSCGGFSVPGHCPGASNIQCCVSKTCSTPEGSGTCKSVSGCSGMSIAGHCPGSSDIQCCVGKSCSTSNGNGACKNTSKGCGGGAFIAGACPGDSSIECCVSGAKPTGNLPGLDSVQSAHARAIIAEAKKEGLGHQGCLAGIATGLTESSMLVLANHAVPSSFNYPHDGVGSDYDSIGIFQQRALYYKNIAADMDPARSAAQFFAIMKGISGWKTMDVGVLCQKVQGSAYPSRYDEHLSAAKAICAADSD